MTAAGSNVRGSIFRYTNLTDDEVGGAVVTGTLVYESYPLRFQGNMPSQLLLQQGYETERTFSAIIVPGTLDIRERDELEITFPLDHVYYGKRFRIVGVVYSDHNPRDPRNKIHLSLVRSVRSHANIQ